MEFKGNSVAIVGSSGMLLDTEFGNLIDSHDYIIRFNAARVDGFEKHVGRKTNLRITNINCFLGKSGNARFPANDPKFIANLPIQDLLIIRPPLCTKEMFEKRRGINTAYLLDDSIWNICRSELGGTDPSVGYIGLQLALEHFKEISVFGFDHGTIQNEKRHYWEPVRGVGGHHKMDREDIIFKELETDKRIKIYK